MTPGISDHDAVLFDVVMSPNYKFTPKRPHKIYQWYKGDIAGLRDSISTFASTYVASDPEANTVNENWALIADNILKAIDKYIPSIMSKHKRHLPWVSRSLKNSVNRLGEPESHSTITITSVCGTSHPDVCAMHMTSIFKR